MGWRWQLHGFGHTILLQTLSSRTHGSYHCHENMRTDTLAPTGQHPEDAQDLLQGQGLQEAHPAQGHPLVIHSRGPDAHTESAQSTRLARLLCSPRVSAVTTVSSPVTEVRPSPSSTRGPRPPRRLSSDWSAQLARPRHRYDHCAPHLHTHG